MKNIDYYKSLLAIPENIQFKKKLIWSEINSGLLELTGNFDIPKNIFEILTKWRKKREKIKIGLLYSGMEEIRVSNGNQNRYSWKNIYDNEEGKELYKLKDELFEEWYCNNNLEIVYANLAVIPKEKLIIVINFVINYKLVEEIRKQRKIIKKPFIEVRTKDTKLIEVRPMLQQSVVSVPPIKQDVKPIVVGIKPNVSAIQQIMVDDQRHTNKIIEGARQQASKIIEEARQQASKVAEEVNKIIKESDLKTKELRSGEQKYDDARQSDIKLMNNFYKFLKEETKSPTQHRVWTFRPTIASGNKEIIENEMRKVNNIGIPTEMVEIIMVEKKNRL